MRIKRVIAVILGILIGTLSLGQNAGVVEACHDWSSYQFADESVSGNKWKYVRSEDIDESKFGNKLKYVYGENDTKSVVDAQTGKKITILYEWVDANGTNNYKYYGFFKEDSSGKWFEDTSGWYPANQWVLIGGTWYWFDENGYIPNKEGWYWCNDAWYYFSRVLESDNYYYEVDEWRDGYWLGADGKQTYQETGSWHQDSKGWWYSDTSGWYPKNAVMFIDGNVYAFNSDGYLASDEWVRMDYFLRDDSNTNREGALNVSTDWNYIYAAPDGRCFYGNDGYGYYLIDGRPSMCFCFLGKYDENGNWTTQGSNGMKDKDGNAMGYWSSWD